jgi:hypothetical protein
LLNETGSPAAIDALLRAKDPADPVNALTLVRLIVAVPVFP